MTLSSEHASAAVQRSGADPGPIAPRLRLRQRYLLQATDLVALTGSAFLGAWIVSIISPSRAGRLTVADIAVAVATMALALHLHGLYRRPASRLRPSGWWRPTVVARAVPTGVLFALFAGAMFLRDGRMTLAAAVAMAAPAAVMIFVGRRLVVRALDPLMTRVLIIGTGPVTERLSWRLRRCNDVEVVGHVDDDVIGGDDVVGGVADLPALCAQLDIDRVVVAFHNSSDASVLNALHQLQGRVPISEIPRNFELHNWRSEPEEVEGLTIINLPTATLGPVQQALKRIMDLTLASCALTFAAPILLMIAIAIKLDSPGPVFFRQERTGQGGKSFRIFKFRSMTADAWQRRDTVSQLNQSDGPLFKMAQDPRVTRVGAIIRKTSLDELPQLINVVIGEMSLVGPRPLPTEEADRIDGAATARIDVKPGITGLWQVCGRSNLTYADLQHLDSAYVRSWSLLWDIRIMAKTPQVVFRRTGAY